MGVGGSHHTVSLPQGECSGMGASINDGMGFLEVKIAGIRPAGCLGVYRLPRHSVGLTAWSSPYKRSTELTVRRLPAQSRGHMLGEILQKPQVQIHTQLVRDRQHQSIRLHHGGVVFELLDQLLRLVDS